MKLAVIDGDGVGVEVTAEALKVLKAVRDDVETTEYDLGARRYLRNGETLTDADLKKKAPGAEVVFRRFDIDIAARRYFRNGEKLTVVDLESLKQHDAILLGAIGDPRTVPAGVLERGLLLPLRFKLDHAVNLRPSKLYPGASSPLKNPGEIDFVVVREGTEGLYCGNGGTLREGTDHEVASEVSQNTWFGVERVVRDAFRRAQERRKKLTWVHKTNVLVNAGGLWQRAIETIG